MVLAALWAEVRGLASLPRLVVFFSLFLTEKKEKERRAETTTQIYCLFINVSVLLFFPCTKGGRKKRKSYGSCGVLRQEAFKN